MLRAFEGSSGKVLGSSDTVHPGASLIGAVLLFAVAWLMGPPRGAELRARRAERRTPKPVKEGPSKAELALGGDRPPVALVVGAVINLPSIYYRVRRFQGFLTRNAARIVAVRVALAFGIC